MPQHAPISGSICAFFIDARHYLERPDSVNRMLLIDSILHVRRDWGWK